MLVGKPSERQARGVRHASFRFTCLRSGSDHSSPVRQCRRRTCEHRPPQLHFDRRRRVDMVQPPAVGNPLYATSFVSAMTGGPSAASARSWSPPTAERPGLDSSLGRAQTSTGWTSSTPLTAGPLATAARFSVLPTAVPPGRASRARLRITWRPFASSTAMMAGPREAAPSAPTSWRPPTAATTGSAQTSTANHCLYGVAFTNTAIPCHVISCSFGSVLVASRSYRIQPGIRSLPMDKRHL